MVINHAGAHGQVLEIDTGPVVDPGGAAADVNDPIHALDRAQGHKALEDRGALRPRVEGGNHTKVDGIQGGEHLGRHATRMLLILKRNPRSHIEASLVDARKSKASQG